MNTDWKLLSPETLLIYTPHGQRYCQDCSPDKVSFNKLLFTFGMCDEQTQAWWDSLDPNQRDSIVCAELHFIQTQIEQLHDRKNSLIDVRVKIGAAIQESARKDIEVSTDGPPKFTMEEAKALCKLSQDPFPRDPFGFN